MSGANFDNADYGGNNNPNPNNPHTAEPYYNFDPLPFPLSAPPNDAEPSFPIVNEALAGPQDNSPTVETSVQQLRELVEVEVAINAGRGERDRLLINSVTQAEQAFAGFLKQVFELLAEVQSGLAATNAAPLPNNKKRPANDPYPIRQSPKPSTFNKVHDKTIKELLERLNS